MQGEKIIIHTMLSTMHIKKKMGRQGISINNAFKLRVFVKRTTQ